ncbi:MAG: RcpC/CpaB family pilus assembly protein [Chloroflexi bacterium]|nr:RcpC/CpaB family pilus assembly protein [Chloroflexota bacterium]
MKRGSRVLLFLVIVIIILIAVAFFVIRGSFFTAGTGVTETPAPTVNIVVVSQPINRDDEIKIESLTTMPYSQASVTAKMITDPQSIVGKFAIYPLAQGLPLTTDMIGDRPGLNQPGSEAAKVISPGLVAVTIPMSTLSAVAYGIRDGDRINVIATSRFVDVDANFQSKLPNNTAIVTGPGFVPDALPILSSSISSGGPGSAQGRAELDPTLNQALYLVPSEAQRPRLVSQMILQDIQVLHVGTFALTGQQSQTVQQPQEGQPTPTPSPSVAPDLITLIVTPQDAVALTYLMYSGTKFTLTLRAPDDTTRVETEAATLQYLLSQYAIPVPAKLPYVIDMQGVTEPNTVPQAPAQ